MRRSMMSVGRLLFIAMSFVALIAPAGASASDPLFITQSGRELLFSATGGLVVLRAEKVNSNGKIANLTCEKGSIDGFISNLSTLAHRILMEFYGQCLLTVGSETTRCTEPIRFKLLLGELGLLSSTSHLVALLLRPSDGSNQFVVMDPMCVQTTISGTLVGEFPLSSQYNKSLSEAELAFKAINKTQNQALTEIFLLGTQMVKQELEASESLVGKASEESTWQLKGDGAFEIRTP